MAGATSGWLGQRASDQSLPLTAPHGAETCQLGRRRWDGWRTVPPAVPGRSAGAYPNRSATPSGARDAVGGGTGTNGASGSAEAKVDGCTGAASSLSVHRGMKRSPDGVRRVPSRSAGRTDPGAPTGLDGGRNGQRDTRRPAPVTPARQRVVPSVCAMTTTRYPWPIRRPRAYPAPPMTTRPRRTMSPRVGRPTAASPPRYPPTCHRRSTGSGTPPRSNSTASPWTTRSRASSPNPRSTTRSPDRSTRRSRPRRTATRPPPRPSSTRT